mgnify:CR=1 FL=1
MRDFVHTEWTTIQHHKRQKTIQCCELIVAIRRKYLATHQLYHQHDICAVYVGPHEVPAKQLRKGTPAHQSPVLNAVVVDFSHSRLELGNVVEVLHHEALACFVYLGHNLLPKKSGWTVQFHYPKRTWAMSVARISSMTVVRIRRQSSSGNGARMLNSGFSRSWTCE